MNRQIFIDTETTGLDPTSNRIVELGCVLAEDRKIADEKQWYFNPEMQMSDEVIAIHGITNEFAQEQGTFANAVDEFIGFIKDAELIMHNAPFDVGFIDMELKRTGHKKLRSYCGKITDTLRIAKKMHPGQPNNLNALCKRYNIDTSARTKHGALLDSQLLAEAYFAMTSGQSSIALDVSASAPTAKARQDQRAPQPAKNKVDNDKLVMMQVSDSETNAHKSFIGRIKKIAGKCILQD